MSALDALPTEIARHRLLSTRDTCDFIGVSIAEWRRMRRDGEVPPPIMIGSRKQAWRLGDIPDWIASRQSQDRPAA
jgi:predicted DNA-binding transcriptional regulator AlpA